MYGLITRFWAWQWSGSFPIYAGSLAIWSRLTPSFAASLCEPMTNFLPITKPFLTTITNILFYAGKPTHAKVPTLTCFTEMAKGTGSTPLLKKIRSFAKQLHQSNKLRRA